MRKLSVFNSVSIDGYFTDKNSDISWAHKQDPEWTDFVAENAGSGGELLFGRVTYDMMNSFWPTPAAAHAFPEVAEQMNKLPKVVFSKTMEKATWNNTRLLKGNLEREVRKLKEESGPQLVLMGSGTIISQLSEVGLIDEYQIVVNPIALGEGRTMFDGVTNRINLKLAKSRTFKNGNVYLCYDLAK
jgi:dihydrofolate reductase